MRLKYYMKSKYSRFAPFSWFRGDGKENRVPLQVISNATVAVQPQVVPRRDRPADDRVERKPKFVHEEIEIGSSLDAQDVHEYEHVIYRAMRDREVRFPTPQAVSSQDAVTQRALLVDSLCKLHYNMQLSTEAYFRAIGILDRVVAKMKIASRDLLLVGSASMLIASKIEDMLPMSVFAVCKITENVFSPKELVEMERRISTTIEFDTEFPTPLFFLTIFLKLNGMTQQMMLLARYLCELCMTSRDFIGAKSSVVAAAALMMTRTLLHAEPWTDSLAGYTQYAFEDLCSYCKSIHVMLLDRERPESAFMRRKYLSAPFCKVASIPVPRVLPMPFPLYV